MSFGRTNLILGLLTLTYVGTVMGLSRVYGFPVDIPVLVGLQNFGTGLVFLFALALLWALIKERPESPFAHLKVLAVRWRLRERAMATVPPLLCTILVMGAFSSVKRGIPAIVPFSFDPMIADLDQSLHGGRAPWEILQPLLGHPPVTWALNRVYHLWFATLLLAAPLFAVWIERPRLRERFFVAYFLCWGLLGSAGAVFLSSVGPCFYQHFYASDRFAPLMSYLHHADTVLGVPALDIQAQLLWWQVHGRAGLGAGISAMPSLHVAIATLYAAAGWSVSRFWGIAWSVFLGLIFLGSIHLGYHYALDGYVSFVATLAIWQAVGWALLRRPATEMRQGALAW